MSRHRLLGSLSVVAAAICVLIAGAALKWYLWDIVVSGSGNPDRSMLFWGIPILFIGLAALGGGIGFGVLARSLLTRSPDVDR